MLGVGEGDNKTIVVSRVEASPKTTESINAIHLRHIETLLGFAEPRLRCPKP